MKKLTVSIITCLSLFFANAQSVGINNDGSTPNPSAILDIKSANKGLLVPRVNLQSLSDNTTIPNPALSLLVFNTNTALFGGAGFYAWDGNNWVLLLSTANSNFLWSINGNAGTTGAHFIGTTDNARMGFRANNFPAGSIDPVLLNSYFGYKSGMNNINGSNNTAVGNAALFSNQNLNGLVAVGDSSLYNNNNGLGRNTAIGVRSGYSTTDGSGNSFLGYETGFSNTIGTANTAIGWRSLYANTTGVENTAVGVFSLQANTMGTGNTAMGNLTLAGHETGSYNTATGYKALLTDTSGADNTANGAFALFSNKNGTRNTAIGSNSAYFSRSGNENTAIGFDALPNNQNGSYNVAVGAFSVLADSTVFSTAIGYNAQIGLNNLTNATAVGARAVVSKNDAIVLGSIAGVNGATSNVNVGIGTTMPLARFHVKDSSVLFNSNDNIPVTPGIVPVSGAGRRMMWYADKAAFRTGYVNGLHWNTDSIGDYSLAAGYNTVARGNSAAAFGAQGNANGDFSLTAGYNNVAGGLSAVAMGENTTASGAQSAVFGYTTNAGGNQSFASGHFTKANGHHSVAFGDSSTASGLNSFASGLRAVASGINAVAVGENARATGNQASAYGLNTVAHSYMCAVFGRNNDSVSGSSKTAWVEDDPLFIVGNGIGTLNGQRWNALTIYKHGNAQFGGRVEPDDDANYTLGSASLRWERAFIFNGVYSSSDARMKKNIQHLQYGINTVMNLNPVSWNWKKGDSLKHMGFLAQEVKPLLPDMIDEGKNGNLSMNYQELIPVLTKAIQEQQQMIEELKKRIIQLEQKK